MEFDTVRELRRVLANGVPEFLGARPVDAPNVSSDEVDSLYAVLRVHVESGDEQAYQQTLGRLRLAHEAEATRIAQHFEAWRRLKPDELDEALRRADDLIQRHALPAEPDPTAR